MTAGVAILAGSVTVAWIGNGTAHFIAGLILLGVGWNFLFTAGSTLITTTYRQAERFKAQGLNDLIRVRNHGGPDPFGRRSSRARRLAGTAAVHAAVSGPDAGAAALHAEGVRSRAPARDGSRTECIDEGAGASVAHRPHPGPRVVDPIDRKPRRRRTARCPPAPLHPRCCGHSLVQPCVHRTAKRLQGLIDTVAVIAKLVGDRFAAPPSAPNQIPAPAVNLFAPPVRLAHPLRRGAAALPSGNP